MLIVQALHWLRDTLYEQREAIRDRLKALLATDASAVLRDDLRQGLPTLPAWMQNLLRNVLKEIDTDSNAASGSVDFTSPISSTFDIGKTTAQDGKP